MQRASITSPDVEASRSFVTVVAGVPRSGTSLLMQMLDAGGLPPLCDEARPPDAHNPRGYFEYAAVKELRRDAGWLHLAVGHAVKVAHVLLPALPEGFDYRLLLLRRDLREVVASQQAMLGPEPAATPGPERLAEIFRQQLDELESWAEARARVEWQRVEHAELLAQPQRAAERVARFLGGGLDVAAMAATVDPALHRQRVALS